MQLKSGVELHLSQGATLRASDDPSLYTPIAEHNPDITANAKICAFLWANEAEDIRISGSGTLDGGGDTEACPSWEVAQDLFRPALCLFNASSNIEFENVTLIGSKWWTLHLRNCDHVRIRAIRMHNTWPNSDGIDPDGCRNVMISDSFLKCGDDCIVFKSTQGHDNDNATITNCILETNHTCFKLGTESFGAFRNIVISNCVMRGHVAFGLFMKDGGVMENIRGNNLVIDTPSDWPILIDAMARDYTSGNPAGSIRNISLTQCSISGPGRVWIEGPADDPASNIRLQDIDWKVTGPVPSPPVSKPTGSARTQTDPDRTDYAQDPAHILAIHTQGLTLNGVQLSGPDAERKLISTFGA